jgi:cell division protein FtsA
MSLTKKKENLYFAVDIGTSTTKALIVEFAQGQWKTLGYGLQSTKGMKKSQVTCLNELQSSALQAIQEAQMMAGSPLETVLCSLSSANILILNSHGIVPILKKQVEIEDIQKVKEAAQAVVLEQDYQILHAIARHFSIDSQRGIQDPFQMNGVRLEVDMHVVSASANAVGNLLQVMSAGGLEVEQVVQDSLASAYGALCEDEKEMGVCLLDIGAGSTKLTVFHKNSPLYSTSFPMAGDQVTSDIALALRTPSQAAETLKIRYGGCKAPGIDGHKSIQIPVLGEKASYQTTYKELYEIITPRVEEILQLAYDKLRDKNLLTKIPTGVVITGGCARLESLLSVAQNIFPCSLRIGRPRLEQKEYEQINSPSFSCVFGLTQWAHFCKTNREADQKRTDQTLWKMFKKWMVN